MLGKTIKLFLIDGEPNGRYSGELSNWTGKAYKIPRVLLKRCTDRPELQNPGIYMLFGKDDQGSDSVYIGEAETVYKRLNQHLSAKEFWTESICFISKDEHLNKAHIKYLENRLYNIAQETGRYNLENGTTPTLPQISEPDIAEMEEFIVNIRLMTNTLGHKLFEDKRSSGSAEKQDEFILKGPRGANAIGRPTSEGFVVYMKSEAANDVTKSMTSNLRTLRQKLINKEIIIESNGRTLFPKDYVFSSPSAAASIVLGRNANGLTEWKLKDGISLREYESA